MSSSSSSSSIIEMVTGKVPYRRLQSEGGFDEYEEEIGANHHEVGSFRSSRSSFRFRRVHVRKRFRLKVPSLRRFFMRRVRLASAVRVSCCKVLKRLKESTAHFGDLFAGNYLFLQVGPTPLKYLDKSSSCMAPNNGSLALPSRYSLQRIA